MLNRTTTININDFLNFNYNKSENFVFEITKSDKFKKFIVILLGCSLYVKEVLAAEKGIDPLGFKLLGIIRHWAYWIILIICVVDVIRCGVSGDSKKILSIIIKYLVVFASMYLVPELFDAIKSAF